MSGSSDETIPQIGLFIQETSVRPPPPPPPQATSSSIPRTSPRSSRSRILPMQRLLPPPPPPPPAMPSTSTSQLHNPSYHAVSPQPSTSFAICHPPHAVMFDTRRPPPPIPSHVQLNSNTLKRPTSNTCEGPPCKSRRTEESNPEDAFCDVCLQREISIENYRNKMNKISTEDEYQTLLFKKKLNEYQRQKEVLRSLVDGDMFRKFEEFVEDVPQYNFRSVLNNLNESFPSGLSSPIPNQMILQMMDYLISQSPKFESSPSARVEDSLRQTLSSMSRSPVSRSSPDLLQTLQDILYNEDRSSSSERPGYRERSVERPQSPGASSMSSYRRYSNGQRVEPRAPPPPAPLLPPAPAPVPLQPVPLQPVAPPAPPPAVTYPHYPPPRNYYPPHPPNYPPAPRPSTSRAPVPPCHPYPRYYHQ